MVSLRQVVAGLLVTLVTLLCIELIGEYLVPIPYPPLIYICAVVFAAYAGGMVTGLLSAVVTLSYAALSLSEPGQFLRFSPDNQLHIIGLAVSTPAVALVMGFLHAREARALQRERHGREKVEAANRELLTLRAALDQVDYGVLLLDNELRAQFINRALRRMIKLPDSMADRKPPLVSLLYHMRDKGVWAVRWESMAAYVAECTARVRSGDTTPLEIRLSGGDILRHHCAVLPDGGRMLSYPNITALVRNAEQLEKLAIMDGMTGVYNRTHFLMLADGEWGRFRRYARPLSLLLLDIDWFKAINDRLGHDIGDEVIIHIANLCAEAKRKSDVIGRIGGEEFAMLLPETPFERAYVVAERFRQAVAERPLLRNGKRIDVSVSIGVAEGHSEMSGISALLKQADDALYAAKRTGRNKVMPVACNAGAPWQATLPLRVTLAKADAQFG